MMINFTITTISILFAVSAVSQHCDKCVRKDKCFAFGQLNQAAQHDWMIKFPCSIYQGKEQLKDPSAAKDYVCCSNNILSILKNSKPMSINSNNDDYVKNTARTNPNSQYNNIKNYANNYNQNSQCPKSSFPPKPETGCCGFQAIETDGRSGFRRKWIQNSSMGLNEISHSTNDGRARVKIDSRIKGGRETELEQFPWAVMLSVLYDFGKKEITFECGGVLISSRYVVTAGHCVHKKGKKVLNIDVMLAEYDKDTFPTDCKIVLNQGQKCIENVAMKTDGFTLHPQFKSYNTENDIALIRLQDNVPYTNYIRPICLPTNDIDSPNFNNLSLTVTGWGRHGTITSKIKQYKYTTVHKVSSVECTQKYSYKPGTKFCAIGYSGEDPCPGDSGGPIMMETRGKYVLVGLVNPKHTHWDCGTYFPTLYTNVYNFLDWIQNNIKP